MNVNPPLLSVRDLSVAFHTDDGLATAVDNISFDLARGETLGLVGESGCGKTVTALSILRLIKKPGEIISGKIIFEEKNLLSLSHSEMRNIRGNKISMIFQEPMTSLNPVYPVGDQIEETILAHKIIPRNEARDIVYGMLDLVGIADGKNRFHSYPHELSGGMKQRILIAIALVCNPSILIADEPTTALDVTVQAQILRLLSSLQKKFGMSVIIISHDLGVIAQVADRIAIMYASQIVEIGNDHDIFFSPKHPYTIGLLQSIPMLSKNQNRLSTIKGNVPCIGNFPIGCHFSLRCNMAIKKCFEADPHLESIGDGHQVACFEWEKMNYSIPKSNFSLL